MIKTSLIALALGICFAGTSLADGNKAIMRETSAQDALSRHPAKSSVIYSNLATRDPNGVYYIGNALPIISSTNYHAVQFIPGKKAVATEIDAGIFSYMGPNGVTLSLYGDKNGQPGKILAGGNATGLGSPGTCCTLAVATISATKLKKGKPYWIVASASGNTEDLWTDNAADQLDAQTTASTTDSGTVWTIQNKLPGFSLQILGK